MTISPRKFGAPAVVGAVAFCLLLAVAVILFRQGESVLSLLVAVAVAVLSAAVLGLAHIVRQVAALPATLFQAGSDAVRGLFDWLGGILQPKVEIRTAILTGLRRFDDHGKLVVGSLRVDVLAQIVETSALGTMLGQATARNVGVQYFIPLHELALENFRWKFTVDQESGERGIAVYCQLPAPQVDEEFIAIDDESIETLSIAGGIQSVNPWSNKTALTAAARAQLKPRALEIARKAECMLAAERLARLHVEQLVQSITLSLMRLSAGTAPPVAVLVQFPVAATTASATGISAETIPTGRSSPESPESSAG